MVFPLPTVIAAEGVVAIAGEAGLTTTCSWVSPHTLLAVALLVLPL
jgi:hypothetical protein